MGDGDVTTEAPTATCSFTSDDLNCSESVVEEEGLEDWGCSRPVWDCAAKDRCVWHAEQAATSKPPEELNATIGSGDLHGAFVHEIEAAALDRDSPVELGLVAAYFEYGKLAEVQLTDSNLREANLESAALSGADLRSATLTDAKLSRADLSDADLRDATLTDAELSRADLSRATLRGATLTNATLTNADLPDTDLTDATFTGATLTGADLTDAVLRTDALTADIERANLTRTDLFDADLRGAAFYGAVLSDTQLNAATRFGDHYTTAERSIGDPDPQRARWCLRKIEQFAEANALPAQARDAFIQRRELRRQNQQRGERWLSTAAGWVMGYGESLGRVAGTGAIIIIMSMVLYPWWGIETSSGQRLSYPSIAEAAATPFQFYAALIDTLLTSLYFSALTFTTLGFGDLRPVGLGRALATFEAGAGVTLFAILVFVLGRRSTR